MPGKKYMDAAEYETRLHNAMTRIVDRKLYDLQRWVAGLKALPKPLPNFCLLLGLDREPSDAEEIVFAYRKMAAKAHPDKGGSAAEFARLGQAKDEALAWIEGRG